MITWRQIKESLGNVDAQRLDDPAMVIVNGDRFNIDLIEIEVDEIQDDRLVGVPTKDIETEENSQDTY